MDNAVNNIPWDKLLDWLGEVGADITGAAKQGLEFVYPLAVKQAIAEGVVNLLLFVVSVIVVALCYWGISRLYKASQGIDVDEGVCIVSMCFLGVIGGLAGVSGLSLCYDAVMNLSNPEWYALMKMSELVR